MKLRAFVAVHGWLALSGALLTYDRTTVDATSVVISLEADPKRSLTEKPQHSASRPRASLVRTHKSQARHTVSTGPLQKPMLAAVVQHVISATVSSEELAIEAVQKAIAFQDPTVNATDPQQQLAAAGAASSANTTVPQQQQAGPGANGTNATDPQQQLAAAGAASGANTTMPQQQQAGFGGNGTNTTDPQQQLAAAGAASNANSTASQQQQAGLGANGTNTTDPQQQLAAAGAASGANSTASQQQQAGFGANGTNTTDPQQQLAAAGAASGANSTASQQLMVPGANATAPMIANAAAAESHAPIGQQALRVQDQVSYGNFTGVVHYKIKVKASGHYLREDSGTDAVIRCVDLKSSNDDAYARFRIVPEVDGRWRIRNTATHHYGWEYNMDFEVRGTSSITDTSTSFSLEPQADWTYRIKVMGTNHYLHEDVTNGILMGTNVTGGMYGYDHVLLEPLETWEKCEAYQFVAVCPPDRCSWVGDACMLPPKKADSAAASHTLWFTMMAVTMLPMRWL